MVKVADRRIPVKIEPTPKEKRQAHIARLKALADLLSDRWPDGCGGLDITEDEVMARDEHRHRIAAAVSGIREDCHCRKCILRRRREW